MAARRGYRNWTTRFKEDFSVSTRPADISSETLAGLAWGKGENAFCLYDLIMNLLELGSGFELHELHSEDKMMVVDRYLLLLDLIRFEYMKRSGWLTSYPGQDLALAEVIIDFTDLGPALHARVPELSRDHPEYNLFAKMDTFEKMEFIRKLIPKLLKQIEDRSDKK